MANTSEDYENFIDLVFEELGSFGKFQKKMMLLMILLSTIPAINIYVTMFNLAEPKLLCRNVYTNQTILGDMACEAWQNISKSNELNLNSSYICTFDDTYYGRSMTTEWNMFCNRRYLASFTQTAHLIGTAASMFTGYFGDHYGRRVIVIACLGLQLITYLTFLIMQLSFLGLSVTSKYVIYCITQVFTGSFSYSLYASSFVYILELTSAARRTLFTNIHLSLFVAGELIVLLFAYTLANFETINWIITAYVFIGLIFAIIFLKESPRWLISQKRFEEAKQALDHIARENGKRGLSDIHENFEMKISHKCEDTDSMLNEDYNIKAMLKHILLPMVQFRKFILLACVWFSLNLLYYGVSLGVTSIDSINPYLMYLFASIAEFLAYMICSLNDKIGRRRASMIYFTLSGIICLVIAFIPRNKDFEDKNKVLIDAIVMILLASFGKCMTSAAFNTVYVFTAEYYETKVRNFAFLFISCCGNIGAFLSPQINLSKYAWTPMPYLIFSSFSLFAFMAVLLLPKIKRN